MYLVWNYGYIFFNGSYILYVQDVSRLSWLDDIKLVLLTHLICSPKPDPFNTAFQFLFYVDPDTISFIEECLKDAVSVVQALFHNITF